MTYPETVHFVKNEHLDTAFQFYSSTAMEDEKKKIIYSSEEVGSHVIQLASLPDSTSSTPNIPTNLHASMCYPPFNHNTTNTSMAEGMVENGIVSQFGMLALSEHATNGKTDTLCHSWPNSEKHISTTTSETSSSPSKVSEKEMVRDMLLFLPDEDGDTHLHISIMHEDDTKSFYFINRAPHFIHLNIINNMGQTPAHLAAITNSSNILRKLICAGADVHTQDKDGNTPLHIASSHGYLEVAKQLLKPIEYVETIENKYPIPFAGIPQNMNVRNFGGHSCLHLAVTKGNKNIVRLLMEAGADPNLGDSKSGRSALHMAAEEGALDIVFLLLSYRSTCVDAFNYAGHTPAQLAYSRQHIRVTELLLRRGAHGYASVQYMTDQSDVEIED